MSRFHPMSSAYRRALTFCLLALLLVTLAACGRGREEEPTAEPPAAAATNTPEPPAEPTATEEAAEEPAATTEPVAETETVTETMTETEEVTDTEAMTDTEVMTGTEEITDTEAMTDSEEITDTEAMTETGVMTDTEEVTDSGVMTETGVMTDTEAVTDTGAMTETEAMTSTEEITDTGAMTETGAAPEAPGDVLATGLNAPQGILVDPDGNVWVVDAGLGGETQVVMTDSVSGESSTAMLGDTSRIVMITADGELSEIAVLPSVLTEREASGGSRLALLDGTLYATSGGWLDSIGPEPMPLMASVVSVAEDGTVTEVANTWDTEVANNPDTFILESHPYGLAAGPDGLLYVADAGANTLLQVDPASGTVTVVATFEGIASPMPNPFRGDAMEMDPVPTGLVVEEDGTIYVSLLTGFPFLPGSAKVVAVSPEGEVSDYATGLTMLTDLRRGPDGELYAVQFGLFGEQGPTPNSGALVHVHEGEGSEAVVEGLSFPTSVDFDAEGNAYITTNGVGAPGSGEVVVVEGVASGE